MYTPYIAPSPQQWSQTNKSEIHCQFGLFGENVCMVAAQQLDYSDAAPTTIVQHTMDRGQLRWIGTN